MRDLASHSPGMAYVLLTALGWAVASLATWLVPPIGAFVAGYQRGTGGQELPMLGWLLIQSWAAMPTAMVFGAVVGLCQWSAVRSWLSPVRWWQWTGLTVVGWTGAVLFLPGLFVGAAQWPLLRGRVRFASVWIPANLVAWLVLPRGAVFDGVGGSLGNTLGWSVATAIAAGILGAIYGAITGIVLFVALARATADTRPTDRAGGAADGASTERC